MAPRPQKVTVTHRAWPLSHPVMTPGGVATATDVILVEISDGDARGRGEAVPMLRFGESVASVIAALDAMKSAVASGLSRDTLQVAMPPGAARNALDSAFWDLDANRIYQGVADLAGLAPLKPVVTAFTLGFDTPAGMAEQAAAQRGKTFFRLELGGDDDVERVRAVRQAAPRARIIVDANEAWTHVQLADYMPALVELRVELIEQPFPAGADDVLAGYASPIPLCADESCCTREDLDRVDGKYAAITIGLGKAGGLTEALALAAEARRRGLHVMVGGPRGTSLGVAPALVVAQQAQFVCLDGPLHLAIDRGSALRYEGGMVKPPTPSLWGGPA